MFDSKKINLERMKDFEIKDTVNTHFNGEPIFKLIQEARSHLNIGLHPYPYKALEDGDNSKYIYPIDPTGRLTLLSDLVGNFQNEDKHLSLWHLISGEEAITRKILTKFIFLLSDLAQNKKDLQPLEKPLILKIQQAILLLFAAMKEGNYFPSNVMNKDIRVLVTIAKSIDKKDLHNLVAQHPEIVKEIHEKWVLKESFQKEVPHLVEVVENIYPQLFSPSQPQSFCSVQ